MRAVAQINKKYLPRVSDAYRYTDAMGEFSRFYKLVSEGETDARLDTAANLLKDLIVVIKSGFNGTIGAIKSVKADTSMMLDKQDESLKMQNLMLDKQDESLKILNNINMTPPRSKPH